MPLHVHGICMVCKYIIYLYTYTSALAALHVYIDAHTHTHTHIHFRLWRWVSVYMRPELMNLRSCTNTDTYIHTCTYAQECLLRRVSVCMQPMMLNTRECINIEIYMYCTQECVWQSVMPESSLQWWTRGHELPPKTADHRLRNRIRRSRWRRRTRDRSQPGTQLWGHDAHEQGRFHRVRVAGLHHWHVWSH